MVTSTISNPGVQLYTGLDLTCSLGLEFSVPDGFFANDTQVLLPQGTGSNSLSSILLTSGSSKKSSGSESAVSPIWKFHVENFHNNQLDFTWSKARSIPWWLKSTFFLFSGLRKRQLLFWDIAYYIYIYVNFEGSKVETCFSSKYYRNTEHYTSV